MQDAAAAHGQDLQRVIKASGVGAAWLNDRLEQVDVRTPEIGFQFGFTRVHPVAVAPDRVDFAIVGQHAERMGKGPRWKSVRTVALVEQGDCRLIFGVREVRVEFFQRCGDEEAFVNNRAVRERGNVEILNLVCSGAVLDLITGQEKSAFVVVIRHSSGSSNQYLLDEWHGGLGLFSQHVIVDRNLTPSKYEQLALFQNLFGDGACACGLILVVRRQEHDAYTEIAWVVEGVPELLHFRRENFIRNLGGNPGPVTGFGIGVESSSVHQTADGEQGCLENGIRAFPTNLGNEPNATGVMLQIGIIESVRIAGWQGLVHVLKLSSQQESLHISECGEVFFKKFDE